MNEKSQSVARRERLKQPLARLERMIEIRVFEDTVKDLFFEGIVHGTTHLCQGQEAVAVGVASALRLADTVSCTYRGHGMALALGCTPRAVLGEIMGRSIGSVGGLGGSMHLSDPDVGLLPTSAIVGAGIPVAVGAGLTAQVLGRDDVAIAVFGDGATNIGAFHEGLNLAAIWALPLVFVIENNLYGEYSPIAHTTRVSDLAERAVSYGMPSAIVDGQDVDAVIDATTEAVNRAREGGGPTLLEMKTYRYAGHSRADAGKYRPDGELDKWLERDPIPLYARQLNSEDAVEDIRERVKARLGLLVEEVKSAPVPAPTAMFAHVFAPGPPKPRTES